MRILVSSLLFLVFIWSCRKNESPAVVVEPSPLESLQAGNKRFMSGHPVHPHETLERIRELKKGQHPNAVVVSCSDSRVPPELIFDQGLGDVFSIRTAGHVIGDYELGSIEYAVEHLGCKLVVVLGHESCGAVKAFFDNPEGYEHPDHIRHIVECIAGEKEEMELKSSQSFDMEHAVEANVRHGVTLLQTSEPILKHMVERGDLVVIGAVYDLDSGEVRFMDNAGHEED